MTRLALFALLLLTSCLPAFSEATPDQIWLEQQGSLYVLRSDKLVERGSVGVRAASVESPYCFPKGCVPNAEGRVLLQLLVGRPWGTEIELGRFEGVKRIRLVIYRSGEDEAIIRTLETELEIR